MVDAATRAGRSARRALAAALAVTLSMGIAACDGDGGSDSEEPRPLTAEESQALALARYRNFDAGVREVRFEVDDGGTRYVVDGWADFPASFGYGTVGDDQGTEMLLIAWSAETVATHEAESGLAPLPPPDLRENTEAWIGSDLTPEASRLHSTLALVLAVGHDRPDNPLLLQQTDARWLRHDEIDGVTVDVIAGPTADVAYDPETSTAAGDGSDATVRYWVDADSTMLRMEVRLAGAGEWTVIDFAEAGDVSFAEDFLDGAVGEA